MSQKLSQNKVIELTGFTVDKIKRLKELNLIKFDGNQFDEESIQKYLDYERKIVTEYYDLVEFSKIVELPGYTDLSKIERYFPDEIHILQTLKVKVAINMKLVFVTKESALKFKKEVQIKKSLISANELHFKFRFSYQKIDFYIKSNKLHPRVSSSGIRYFNLSEIYKIIEEESSFPNKYYSVADFKKLFGFHLSSITLKNLVKDGYLEIFQPDFKRVWVTKKSVDSFFSILAKDYIKLEEIAQIIKIRPKYLINSFTREDRIMVNKQVFIKKVIAKKFIDPYDEYYTLKAIELINNRREGTMYNLLKKNEYQKLFVDIKRPQDNQGWRINKKEIDAFFINIDDLKKNYYTREELQVLSNNKIPPYINVPISSINIPLYMKLLTTTKGKSLYEKEKSNLFLDNEPLMSLIFEQTHLELSDYVKTYIDLRYFPLHLNETKKLLKTFAEKSLSNSQANPLTIDKYKQEYIFSIEYLLSYDLQKELYLYDTSEVIMFLEKSSTLQHRTCLRKILTFIEHERICKYSLKGIPSPHNEKSKVDNNQKEKINFEDWIEIYDYSKSLNKHLDLALLDKQYANIWLFVMILLTNAWRPNDIFRIPSIQPEIIGIANLDWFKDHEISNPQGQKIINIIRSLKLVTAKNGMPRDFTCNLDLVIPMVTALCICEFHRRNTNVPSIIDFTSKRKKKNTVSLRYFNRFFEKSERLKHIKFSPLIANRSLMEHLYYSIQEKQGKGNSAFELVMKFRSHKTDITKEYIGDRGNRIALHLFSRGEFGFLYDQLVELLTDKTDSSLTERTNDISLVKSFFEPYEVENFFRFFTDVMNEEEQNFMDKLLSQTPDNAFEYMRKMYLGHMPAKNVGAQCLIYPNCHRPSNQFSCTQCPFAVHNLYTLTSIFNEYTDSIKRHNNTSKSGVKQREKNTIFKLQNLIIKAIEEFGEDYVFSFFDGGELAFINQLEELKE